MLAPLSLGDAPPTATPQATARIVRAAQDFEAMVLAQLLQDAGVNAPPAGVGGGVGEAQFSTFVTQAQAQAIAARGGVGLAETVLRALLNGQADAR